MSGSKQIVYWDTCLFISWIKDEVRKVAAEKDRLLQVVEQYNRGEIEIATSFMTKLETLPCKFDNPTKQEEQFDLLLKRSSIHLHGITHPISTKCREIRNRVYNAGHKISVPDCIHISTAIIHGIEIFQTFDGADGEKNKLLTLPENIIPEVQIKLPFAMQSELQLKDDRKKQST